MPSAPDPRRQETATAPSLTEVVEYVKTYAQQETVGPLKNIGRWIGYGLAAAVMLGVGMVLVFLGLLRLVQTEWDRAARGSLSWLAYVVVLAACGIVIAVVINRIKQSYLTKEPE